MNLRNEICICWIGIILSLNTEQKENYLLRKKIKIDQHDVYIFFELGYLPPPPRNHL